MQRTGSKILQSRIFYKIDIMAKLKDLQDSGKDEQVKKWKGGRPKKDEQNRCSYLYAFRLNEKEKILFEQLFEKSGANNKTQFITNCIFQRPFQVIVTDKGAMDVCIKLSDINFEIRKIGINYNQAVKALKYAFTEKKALSYLYKLEKRTIELVSCLSNVIEITEQYKHK